MKLIQVIDQNGNILGLFDISETNCPDDHIKQAILDSRSSDDPDLDLEITWGITRVFVEQTILLDVELDYS